MRKILLVGLLSSFIIACGGGDDGNANAVTPEVLDKTPSEKLKTCIVNDNCTDSEISDAYNLPPEPTSSSLNFFTEEGVDENNYGGRDDLERLITFKYYKNEDRVALSLKYFELIQDLIASIKLKDHVKYWEIDKEIDLVRECSFYLYNDYIDYDISLKVFDSKEREQMFLDGDILMSPYKNDILSYNFTKEELSEKCYNL